MGRYRPQPSQRRFRRRLVRVLVDFHAEGAPRCEYALEKCLDRHLAPAIEALPRAVVQYYTLTPLLEDVTRVLSMLARLGHADEPAAARAYEEAIASLGSTGASRPMLPAAQSGLAQADVALGKLAGAIPIIRKQFLHAAALAVAGAGAVVDAGDVGLKIYLYSRAQSVMGGTSQIQKNIVATRILGLPTA